VSSTLGIAIMMNNYFHDVATALLLASGVVMLIIVKKMERSADDSVKKYFLKIYTGVTRLAKFSLLWILIGGIPRTLAYKEFEWANAAGKGQVTALIIKHILAFIFVGGGAVLWLKLHKRVREIRESVK
jgi:heme/copper-type cytochrome/quinol oxidase subunit 3